MKKYKDTQQIERDIDKAYQKIEAAKKSAQDHLDTEALLIGTTALDELRYHREMADTFLRKIKRLETVRLPKLKEKLQEMNTIALPLTGEQSRIEPEKTSELCKEIPTSPAALLDDARCLDLTP